MAKKNDLLVRIDTTTDNRGFKSAEAAAKALERELNRVETAQRQMAQQEFAAHREMAARAKAAADAEEQASIRRRAAMSDIGRSAFTMGAAVALGLGIAGKAAMDWESAWAGARKTIDGSPEEMAALEQELRSLGAILPATHEEIAGVAEAAGQLGVKRADIAAFTKTAIDMGETTNLSAEEAATGLAQLGNVMGVLPGEADRAGAALVALGNDGASTEADILAMSLRIAGAGKTIGLTQAQVMGLASGLSSVGIEAEAGGSAISRVMVDIAQAVDQGGDKLDGFAEVAGMSTEEFSRAFREDAAGAVLSFIEGLGRMNATGQSTFQVLDDLQLSEIRVRDALLRTANAGGLLRDSVKLGSEAWRENSALVEEANKRYQTSEARLAMARNQLNDAAIDIGANLLPALAGAAGRAGALAEAFHGLPPEVQEGITVLGGIAATAGLAGGAALMLIPKLHELNTALSAMGPRGQSAARGLGAVGGFLTGPWGLAIAGATLALGIWADGQYRANARAEALAATLDEQTGAITENTRANVANQLESEGVLALAQKLGLSLEDVTDAALGNAAAQRRVAEAIAAYRAENEQALVSDGKAVENAYGKAQANDRLNTEITKVTGAIQGENEAVEAAAEKHRRHEEAVGADAGATEEAASSTDRYAAALSAAGDEAAAAAGGAQGMATQVAGVAISAEDAEKAVDELSKTLDRIFGAMFSVEEATDTWQTALNGLTQAARDNGLELQGNSDKALANREQLRGLVQDGLSVIDTMAQQGATSEELAARSQELRDEFIRVATQLDYNEAEVRRYAGAFDRVPGAVSTLVDAQTETALAKLSEVSRRLAALDGTTADVAVRYRETGGGTLVRAVDLANADGRVMVESYARGGFRPLPSGAMFAKDGANLVQWAERGTGGESFIPLAPSKRAASIPIWAETGRRLGVQFVAFRDGGIRAGGAGLAGGFTLPPIYVQNPFTGEYLLAQVSSVAEGVTAGALRQAARNVRGA